MNLAMKYKSLDQQNLQEQEPSYKNIILDHVQVSLLEKYYLTRISMRTTIKSLATQLLTLVKTEYYQNDKSFRNDSIEFRTRLLYF